MSKPAALVSRILTSLLLAISAAWSAEPAGGGDLISPEEYAAAGRRTLAAPTTQGSLDGAAWRLALALTGFLLAAGGAVVVVRRLGWHRRLPGRVQHLQLIESLPIGPRRAISLLRIGDQVLVVGQTDHGITHLATLAQLPEASQTPQSRVEGFRARLQDLLGGK